MASKAGIIDHALFIMGEEKLDDPNSPAGQVLYGLYTTILEELLTDHRWRFAIKKEALTEASGSPVNEYSHHFDFPDDYLMIIRTYPASLGYEIFEDKLLTNSSSVSIDFIFNPGEKKFPSYFVNLFSHRLAAETCMTITNNASLTHEIKDTYSRLLGSAQHKDSQGRPPATIVHKPYVDVRA